MITKQIRKIFGTGKPIRKPKKNTTAREIYNLKEKSENIKSSILSSGGFRSSHDEDNLKEVTEAIEDVIIKLTEKGLIEDEIVSIKPRNLYELSKKIQRQEDKATENDINFLQDRIKKFRKQLK